MKPIEKLTIAYKYLQEALIESDFDTAVKANSCYYAMRDLCIDCNILTWEEIDTMENQN